MIIEKSVGPAIKTSDEFQELEFGVRSEDMGLILEILRSKMYSNPIGSICREISSNSRDANREAGNSNPIEISIRDSIWLESDLVIAFKDEGLGISPERIGDVFVNYGASTKRNTNDQTGGFGLGAKTPFSYSDNFTIITIVDSIRYVYTAVIEEGKRGKLYLLEKQETEDLDGTTILIPLQEDDREEFEKESIRATVFWETQPNYINFESFEDEEDKKKLQIESLYVHEDCEIVSQDCFNSKYNLLIDQIIYPLDDEQIKFAENHWAFDNTILLKFNTGDLTISANRESVQYDPQTIEAINGKFENFLNHIEKKIQERIETAPDYLHACIYSNALSGDPFFKDLVVINNLYSAQKGDLELKYKGKELHSNFHNNEDDNGDRVIRSIIISKNYSEKRRKKSILSNFNSDFISYPIYFMDRKKPTGYKDRTIFKENEYYISIEFKDKGCLDFSDKTYMQKKSLVKPMKQALKAIKYLKSIGIKFEMYSTLKNTAAPKKDPTEVSTEKRFFVRTLEAKGSNSSYRRSRRSWRRSYSDDGPLYVHEMSTNVDGVISRFKPFVYFKVERDNLDSEEVRNAVKWAKIIERFSIWKVVFVTGKYAKLFKDRFLTIDEAIKCLPEEKLRKVAANGDIGDVNDEIERFNQFNYSKKVQDCVDDLMEESKKEYENLDLPNDFKERFGCVSTRLDEAKKLKKHIRIWYPLLREVSWSLEDDEKVKYNVYIETVDRDRELMLNQIIRSRYGN